MSENSGTDTEPEQEDLGTFTDEELAQQFVMWVEVMIHDVESVPDDASDQK